MSKRNYEWYYDMLQPQSQHYSNASCMSSTPVQSQKPVHVNHSSPTRMSNRECQNNNTQPGIMHARVICNQPVRVAPCERTDLELVRSLTEEPPSEVSELRHRGGGERSLRCASSGPASSQDCAAENGQPVYEYTGCVAPRAPGTITSSKRCFL